MLKFKIIAADGTAGSGKSSICNKVSKIKVGHISIQELYKYRLAHINNIPTNEKKTCLLWHKMK